MIAWAFVILFWCAVVYGVGHIIDQLWFELAAMVVGTLTVFALMILLTIEFLRYFEAWPFISQ